jgi:hypothetical protein
MVIARLILRQIKVGWRYQLFPDARGDGYI